MGRLTTPGFGPTQEQKLLLDIIFEDDIKAIAAWRQWREVCSINDTDQGSYRMLPLVYNRLKYLEVDELLQGELRQIYLHYWAHNEKLFREADRAVKTLMGAGIFVIQLKGKPMVQEYYKDPALRPMGDVDILVPKKHFIEAIGLLEQAGWNHRYDENVIRDFDRYFHAVNFALGKFNLDLHWQILPGIVPDGFVTIQSNGAYTLAPTDLLFHTLVHGARWSRIPPIRWMVDAGFILRERYLEIDWDRIVKLARTTNSVLQIRSSLTLLRLNLGISIPDAQMTDLMSIKIPFSTRLAYLLVSSSIPVIWDFFNNYFYFRNFNKTRNMIAWTKYFLGYLRIMWGIDTPGGLLNYGLKLLHRRLYMDLFTPPYFKRKNITIHEKGEIIK